jgi:hypothetical protein
MKLSFTVLLCFTVMFPGNRNVRQNVQIIMCLVHDMKLADPGQILSGFCKNVNGVGGAQ